MSAYIVATVTISDPIAFKEYGQIIAGLSDQYGGEAVTKGPVAEVMEGHVPSDEIVVILKFPDADKAKAYINSETYQKGKAVRQGAGTVNMRLLVD